jgi:thiamine biosynthesis lipoprotein
MGTIVEYTIATEDAAAARKAVESAHRELERVSSLLWEGDSLSAISRVNASDSTAVGPEVASFLGRSEQYRHDTDGAFDVTIGSVLSLYDFGAVEATPPLAEAISARLSSVGKESFNPDVAGVVVKNRPDARVAVGGMAKGYGVDKAVGVLRRLGVEGAVVNAGGDLYCLGSNNGRRWRVGIRDPDDPAAVVQVLHVSDDAVATSGDYQQFFMHEGVRYHHILDPTDGRPARGLRSATVIAATTEMADVLATAAFVLGAERGVQLLEERGANGMLIDSSGQRHVTRGLSKYLEND